MIFYFQTDAVSEESIVYVSEPQQLAHVSEEIIDVVENPLSSTVSSPYCSIHCYFVCANCNLFILIKKFSQAKAMCF